MSHLTIMWTWWCNNVRVKDIFILEQLLASQSVPWIETQLHLVCLVRPHQLAVLPIHMYLDAITQKRTPPLPCTGQYAIIELMAYWVRFVYLLPTPQESDDHKYILSHTGLQCPCPSWGLYMYSFLSSILLQGLKQGTSSSWAWSSKLAQGQLVLC